MTTDQDSTPRQLEQAMKIRCPKPGEADRLYSTRNKFIERLQTKESVEPQDLEDLDRLGRVKVASDLWAKCSPKARNALLDDFHHQVRSCALISSQGALQ